MDQNHAREIAVETLRRRGFVVKDVSQGQGVPKLSRLLISRAGQKAVCVVKYSTGGRISFAKAKDGSFTVLPEVDFVLHVRPVFDGEESVRVSLFPRSVVADAFAVNMESLRMHKMSHIPSWVNPDHEPGWRLEGSGFGKDALWSEVVRPTEHAAEEPQDLISPPDTAEFERGISIAEAKARLSITFGVPADAIEITIRG